MNYIDIIILIMCFGALVRGYQIGLIRQLGSTLGFIAGLYPGTLLSGWIMGYVDGPYQPLAGLCAILTVCFIFMTITELFSSRIKFAVRNRTVQSLDDGTGAVMSVVTLLVGLWLAAALFTLAPQNSLQAQIKNSYILNTLAAKLPPAASVLSALNKLVDPNQSPLVFSGREPSPNANYTLPDITESEPMLKKASTSVMKIEGLGCGGIVDGSGFVYSPNLIVTNAHVVAGVKNPKVRYQQKTYDATAVVFDSQNDIAVLRVPGMPNPPLAIAEKASLPNTAAFALGYPGGGDYAVSPAVVLEKFNAIGEDIYGQTRTTRSVYSLQSTVVRGNSGGPVVNEAGEVIGVIFAMSTTYNNIGYALTNSQVQDNLSKGQRTTAAVSTGRCST